MNGGFKLAMNSLGLFLVRVGASAMMVFGHGWGKVENFETLSQKFADPFGLGDRNSLILAIVGEVVAPALVAVGLLSRLAALLTVITMGVAIFYAHGSDPIFPGESGRAKEMAIMYLIPFLAIVLCGPGKISIDALLFRDKPVLMKV